MSAQLTSSELEVIWHAAAALRPPQRARAGAVGPSPNHGGKPNAVAARARAKRAC